MAAINSVITSALDRAIDGIFDLSTISRYFTTFDPTPQTYISLSSAITLASDFEIESTITYSSSPTSAISILGGALETSYIRFDSTTTLKAGTPSGNIFITISPALDYTKRNVLRIVKVGALHTVYLNDVEVGSNTGTSGNLEVSRIGSKGAASFHDGVIADVKIWDGGDRDTGTLVLDMPIDGSGYGTNTLVDNNQTVLGSESWISGEQTLLTGTQTSALNLGGQTPVYIQLPSDIEVTENGSWIGLGSTSVVITTQYVTFRNNSGSTIVFTPSVKEIPAATPLGTAENFADSYSEEFFLQESGDWLAGDLWTYGDYTYTGSEADYSKLAGDYNSPLVSTARYKYRAEYNLTTGSVDTYIKLGDQTVPLTNSVTYEGILNVTGGDDLYLQAETGAAASVGTSISNVSVKRILEAP